MMMMMMNHDDDDDDDVLADEVSQGPPWVSDQIDYDRSEIFNLDINCYCCY